MKVRQILRQTEQDPRARALLLKMGITGFQYDIDKQMYREELFKLLSPLKTDLVPLRHTDEDIPRYALQDAKMILKVAKLSEKFILDAKAAKNIIQNPTFQQIDGPRLMRFIFPRKNAKEIVNNPFCTDAPIDCVGFFGHQTSVSQQPDRFDQVLGTGLAN